MAPPRGSTSASSGTNLTSAHSLSLLSEYSHTLDSFPLDLSRNFADLRELDAVLSSSMSSITTKIQSLTNMIEQGTSPKEERLWLLTEIAEEAHRLKLGGEDKIRVACQAADNLKSHAGHLRTLAEHLPGFDITTLNRKTTYPHVAARSFMPTMSAESGRRRRGGFGSLLTGSLDPSPAKRKRAVREDDIDVQARSPRKDGVAGGTARPRNGGRNRKHERAISPTESLVSVTSHVPYQAAQNQASSSRTAANHNSNRVGNGTPAAATNKRVRSSANNNRAPSPQSGHDLYTNTSTHDQTSKPNSNITNPRREAFNVPPSSSHPSLPPPFQNNGLHADAYDLHAHPHPLSAAGVPGDWVSTRPPHTLEGPGMPVARSVSSQPTIPPPSISAGSADAGGAGTEGPPTEVGDGDGDGDDKTYCFCDGISYGEMIACDEQTCEREWFHLACIGLTVPPEGLWFCETCRTKRNAKRAGRGGRRQRSRRPASGVLIG